MAEVPLCFTATLYVMAETVRFYEIESYGVSLRAKKHDNGMWGITYSPQPRRPPLDKQWFGSLEELEESLAAVQAETRETDIVTEA